MEIKRLEKVKVLERKLARQAKKAVVSRGDDGGAVGEPEKKSTRKRIISEKGKGVVGKKPVGEGVVVGPRGGKTKSIAGAGMVRRTSCSSTLSITSAEEDPVAPKLDRNRLGMFKVDKPSLRSTRSKS